MIASVPGGGRLNLVHEAERDHVCCGSIFDWDEASGRSHHVGYAPESDLIAASPRNDVTGHYRRSGLH